MPGAESAPLAEARAAYVPFETSPFPYRGIIPLKDVPFLDAVDGKRRGHTSPRAGKVYWENPTYADRRSLIYFPAGFDIRRPAVIVVFFHGNQATLARDVVDRQQLPRQVAESGLNAVLLAPQFAVDAIDSSSGNFWTPGAFARYLDEASAKMASVLGDETARAAFARMPVLLVAYSGGYNAAAYAADVGGAEDRIRGLVLLDAVYAEEGRFADWISRNRKARVLLQRLYEILGREQPDPAGSADRAWDRLLATGAVEIPGRRDCVLRHRPRPRARRSPLPCLGRRSCRLDPVARAGLPALRR